MLTTQFSPSNWAALSADESLRVAKDDGRFKTAGKVSVRAITNTAIVLVATIETVVLTILKAFASPLSLFAKTANTYTSLSNRVTLASNAAKTAARNIVNHAKVEAPVVVLEKPVVTTVSPNTTEAITEETAAEVEPKVPTCREQFTAAFGKLANHPTIAASFVIGMALVFAAVYTRGSVLTSYDMPEAFKEICVDNDVSHVSEQPFSASYLPERFNAVFSDSMETVPAALSNFFGKLYTAFASHTVRGNYRVELPIVPNTTSVCEQTFTPVTRPESVSNLFQVGVKSIPISLKSYFGTLFTNIASPFLAPQNKEAFQVFVPTVPDVSTLGGTLAVNGSTLATAAIPKAPLVNNTVIKAIRESTALAIIPAKSFATILPTSPIRPLLPPLPLVLKMKA